MFAVKTSISFTSHILLIVIVLFHALLPTSALAYTSTTTNNLPGSSENKIEGTSDDVGLTSLLGENNHQQSFARPTSNVSKRLSTGSR